MNHWAFSLTLSLSLGDYTFLYPPPPPPSNDTCQPGPVLLYLTSDARNGGHHFSKKKIFLEMLQF